MDFPKNSKPASDDQSLETLLEHASIKSSHPGNHHTTALENR